MSVIAVTIDSCVWLRLLDQNNCSDAEQLLQYCVLSGVQIFSSSRVLNFDVVKMRVGQRSDLEELFLRYSVQTDGAEFRFGSVLDDTGSSFGGDDFFGSVEETEEAVKFKAVFGKDPADMDREQTGRKLSNWIGDYDALKQHYLKKRDIFVTYDTKIYMDECHRNRAHTELGFLINDPLDALNHLRNRIGPI